MWTRSSSLCCLVVGIFLLVGVCTPVLAQTGQTVGEITGKVVDDQGGVLPGVTVTLTGATIMGKRTGVTDEAGIYHFPAVPPGVCTVTFELSGFTTIVREGLIVGVRTTVTQDVVMKVASVKETVTVSGAAPLVDLQSAKLGGRLDTETLATVPTSRSVWGTVMLTPGLVSSGQDVGGVAAAVYTGMANHGMEGYNFNFMGVIADSFEGNGADYYIDYNSTEEISVETAAMSAEVGGGGGANINIIPKSGSNVLKGSAFFTGTGRSLAWNNVDARLQSLGIVGLGNMPLRLYDVQFDAGGPIKRDKIWLYGSFRDYVDYESIPGFPIDNKNRLRNYTFRSDIAVTPKNLLTIFYAPVYKLQPTRFGAFNVPPQSTSYAYSPKNLVNGSLTSNITDRTSLEVGASFYLQHIMNDYSRQWYANPTPATYDITRGVYGGARSSGNQDQHNKRLQAKAAITHYRDKWLGAAHQIKVGSEVDYGHTNDGWTYFDDTEFEYSNGAPYAIVTFNTPLVTQSTMRLFAAFAQDRISYRRVTANLGVRYAYYAGNLPQQQGGGGEWVPQTTYPALDPGFSWGNFAPRTAVTVNLTGDGKNVAKASYSRYFDHMFDSEFNVINPNGMPSSGIATYRWYGDLNGNGVLDPSEYSPSPLSVYHARSNRIDPNLKQPQCDEITFSYQRQLGSTAGLSVSWVQRWYRDNWADVDVGVPASAYTPVTIRDPGPDNLLNTADDTSITMYSVTSQYLGRDAYVRQTVPGTSSYKGLELSVNKRMSNRWQLQGSYVWSRNSGVIYASMNQLNGVHYLPDPNNPNNQINSYGDEINDQPHAFKLATTYQAPWGLQVGANVTLLSGLPLDRTLRASLTQGSVTVRADPRGTYRQDATKLVAIKLDKQVSLWGRTHLRGFVEIHNLLNSNAGQSYATLTQGFASQSALAAANAAGTSYFGRVTAILPPRLVKLGVKFEF